MLTIVVVLGHHGMLGNYVYSYLKSHESSTFQVHGLARPEFDATCPNSRVLSKFEPKLDENRIRNNVYYINCIGAIPQKVKDNRTLITVNTLFPIWLNNYCKEQGDLHFGNPITNRRIIHITTDCVFSGKHGKYTETDTHDELGVYGVSKSLGEKSAPWITAIRTSIIGEEMRGKKSLLEWVRSMDGKMVKGYLNHYWNGITCLQLAKVVKHIFDSEDGGWKGVRHIFSPEQVSKCDLVLMINDAYKLNVMVVPYSDGQTVVDKTLRTVFDTNAKFEIPSIRQQLQEQAQFSRNLAEEAQRRMLRIPSQNRRRTVCQ